MGTGLGMFAATMFALSTVLVRFPYRLGENAFTLTTLRTGFAGLVVCSPRLPGVGFGCCPSPQSL